MRKVLTLTVSLLALAAYAGPTLANDELIKLEKDPKQWVMQTGDYANQRYSELNQITKDNVGKLQVAWTFSTGVLRGHEGGPLVDRRRDVSCIRRSPTSSTRSTSTMTAPSSGSTSRSRIRTSFRSCAATRSIVALPMRDGKIILHQADTTLVALDAKTGEVVWSVKNGDPCDRRNRHHRPDRRQGQGHRRHFRRRVRRARLVTAYNLKDGSLAWRAYSMGPDSDTLIDPEKTTALGKPVGKDSGTATWEGDQWKIGGGTTWGWYSYDPELNLVYYGSGNPSTWNPKQRPGDNRWSMTIFARDPDTGMAKWVYQMTPHDEWDFDGINEMILADIKVEAARTTRSWFTSTATVLATRSTVRPANLLVAEKYDPGGQLGDRRRHGQEQPEFGRPQVVAKYSTEQNGEDVNSTGHLPGGPWLQGPAAGGVLAEDQAVLRADQPRLHGL